MKSTQEKENVVYIDKHDERDNFENFENVEVKKIPIHEFLELPAVPMQRNTESRAKTLKVRKMLSVLQPTHLEVALCRLKNDDTYYGHLYKKGWTGISNGNTRKYYWVNNLTNRVPSHVWATIYYCDNMEEVRNIYNQYDNPDQMERTQEKVWGILTEMYKFEPKCEKISKGEFITGLNYACHKISPKIWNQPKTNPNQLPFQLGKYIDEIKLFDNICKRRSNWDQALVSAALMSLKKHGNNKKLIECLTRIDDRNMNTGPGEWDGATHICLEWTDHKRFPTKTTGNWEKAGGFNETVSFILYWIENYINDIKLKQPGYNWRETSDKWFADEHKIENALTKHFLSEKK